MSPDRQRLLRRLAARVAATQPERRILVAIDGVDGAGKTTFTDELAMALAGRRPTARASVDGFHQPAAVRYRLGRASPLGFYLDSYDYPALQAELLAPFAANLPYRSAVFDHRDDRPVAGPHQVAGPSAALLLDGIFLHRPELAGWWDVSIFLDVDFAVSIPRSGPRLRLAGPGRGSEPPLRRRSAALPGCRSADRAGQPGDRQHRAGAAERPARLAAA